MVDSAARLKVAARANVPPFHVMDLLAASNRRQETHGDLLNLVAGQPSTGAPQPVVAEAKRLLDADVLGYTVASGVLPLREAIAKHHSDTYDLDLTADDVVVTTGSSGGFLLAFLSAFEAGDQVVMANPGYPCYRNVLAALGCEVVEIQCGADTRFQPTLAQLQQLEGPIDGLLIASPANPTGTMIDAAELAQIARWCEDTGVRLISDEIYHGISYGPATSSSWQTSRSGIVFGSFSKYFSMTGWRLGWMLVPEDLRRPVDVLAGNFTICPPTLSQHAAIAAFTDQSRIELDGHVARYAKNRELLLGGLADLGISKLAPADGAFYVYADVSELTNDSYAWCRKLLDDTGVAVAPGIDFDTQRGNEFVRMSFAGSAEEIGAALTRLGDWLPT
ncbi:MAG: pyridoxal phosphate-dependent aminotransferase [Nocardioidaceae bacterium]|nr:pyridoxal phosphate-dependent aminotransferase [Marmoricola sp.]